MTKGRAVDSTHLADDHGNLEEPQTAWDHVLRMLRPFCAGLRSDTGLTRARTTALDQPLRLRQSAIIGEAGTFENLVRSSIGFFHGRKGYSWIGRDNQISLCWCSRSENIKAILTYALIESREPSGLVMERAADIRIAVHRDYVLNYHATTLLEMVAERLAMSLPPPRFNETVRCRRRRSV
jgi:hypothetical protein